MGGGARALVLIALGAALVLLSPRAAQARPGDLDSSFGAGGIVDQVTPDGTEIGTGAPIVVQPDGKIVVAGQDAGGTGSVLLERFTATGELDPTFGSHGVVLTDVGLQNWRVALARQRNGDLLVAGETIDGSNHPQAVVLRYLPDGSLDPSFGGGGKVVESSGGGTAITVQPDGRILVGTRHDADSAQVFRFMPNGTLDGSFGSGGVVTLPDGEEVESLVVQPDGGILLVDPALHRLMPNGAPDQSFGNDGEAEVSGRAILGWQVALEADGRVVGAGYSTAASEMQVWRVLSNGDGDPSFGTEGIVTVAPTASPSPYNPPSNWAFAVAVQPDGAVLATGSNYGGGYGEPGKLETVRLTHTGGLDPSFGDGGRVLTPLAHVTDGRANSIALDGTGGIVIGAYGPGDGTTHIVLARYDGGPGAASDGSPTTSNTAGTQNAGTPRHASAAVLSLFARRVQTWRSVRRRGLRVSVRASRSGTVVLRLGTAHRRRKIRVHAARTRRITLRPRRGARRIRLRAQLRVRAKPIAARSLLIRLK